MGASLRLASLPVMRMWWKPRAKRLTRHRYGSVAHWMRRRQDVSDMGVST